ncbi:hypothetical protein LCGC14_3037980, partial [marine sediment metagenome]
VGESLEQIRSENEGRLTPGMVVRRARAARNVLHAEFEWDDKLAAAIQRDERARNIIRSIVVVSEDDDDSPTVRAFVSVIQDDDDDASYTHIEHAMSDKVLRKQVLDSAYRELKIWRKKYADLREFDKVFNAVDKMATV